MVALAAHTLFLVIYTFFDSSVLVEIIAGRAYGASFVVAGVTLFEGLASGLIITFCLMQFFKKTSINALANFFVMSAGYISFISIKGL